MTIAGVRLRLSGLFGEEPFPPCFRSFRRDGVESDLGCDVFAAGPDAALAALPDRPGRFWIFTHAENECEVCRLDQGGRALWRMVGAPDFSKVRVSWHPRLFERYYGSYTRTWSMGLGLTVLGMRLRVAGGLLLHGTAAVLDGDGILCVGVSGVGKSTLARLLAAAGVKVLTDERPAARLWPSPERAFRVYGTPWPSSAEEARNEWAPLRRLYFLTHGVADQISELARPEALRRLIPVTTVPWQTPQLLDPCLHSVDALVNSVPAAELAFRPTDDVVALLRRDLCRLKKGPTT